MSDAMPHIRVIFTTNAGTRSWQYFVSKKVRLLLYFTEREVLFTGFIAETSVVTVTLFLTSFIRRLLDHKVDGIQHSVQ